MMNLISQNNSSSTNDDYWVDLCELAGHNNLVLKNFRSFPAVKEIIGGYPDYAVLEYSYRITKISDNNYKKYLDLWAQFDKILLSDNFIIKFVPSAILFYAKLISYKAIKKFNRIIISKLL